MLQYVELWYDWCMFGNAKRISISVTVKQQSSVSPFVALGVEQEQQVETLKAILLPRVKEQDESSEIVHCLIDDALLKHLLPLPGGNQWVTYNNKLLYKNSTALRWQNIIFLNQWEELYHIQFPKDYLVDLSVCCPIKFK